LTHDEFVLRLIGCRALDGAHDDGLQNAELADRDPKLFKLFLTELGARLLSVGHDVERVEIREAGTRNGDQVVRSRRGSRLREEDVDRTVRLLDRRNQGADASTESSSFSH